MYEHPYLIQRVTEFEIQQLERAAERRRFLAEHADQIVRRPEGPVRRLLRRIADGSRGTDAAAGESKAAARNDLPADAAASRRATAPCPEPATAR